MTNFERTIQAAREAENSYAKADAECKKALFGSEAQDIICDFIETSDLINYDIGDENERKIFLDITEMLEEKVLNLLVNEIDKYSIFKELDKVFTIEIDE